MNNTQKQNLALNVTSSVVAFTLNVLLDEKLAKNQAPGKVNRFVRRQLAWGRTYGSAIAIASAVITHIAND